MVERILGCVGLVIGGSIPATGQLRGRGGWGHGKGSLGQLSTFPWTFWGSRIEGVAGWHGQRGRERWEREWGIQSPQDGVRPTTCSALLSWPAWRPFQSGATSQISRDFTLNSGLPASLENSELWYPQLEPLHGRSWPAVRASTTQYRPFTSLTRDQWAVPCGIVHAPLGCLCFFSDREEESETLFISVSLLKMGKRECHQGATRSPGCPGCSHSCLPGGDTHCGHSGGSELRKTLPSSSRALWRKEGTEGG